MSCEIMLNNNSLCFRAELVRIGSFVPVHERFIVSVVLLEADEFLFKKNATTIGVVMSGKFVDVLTTSPHDPTVLFIHNLVRSVKEGKAAKDEQEPEATVFLEIHVAIVVHWVVGARTLEVNYI